MGFTWNNRCSILFH